MSFQRIPLNDNFLNKIGPKQAWFLGIMAADGCINKERYFSISQSGSKGKKLINKIKSMLKHQGKKLHHYKNSYKLHACSPILVSKMADFNITPRKSLVYKFPQNILKVGQLVSFVRGYIDGDGCVGIYDTGTTKTLLISLVGTKQFVKYLVKLLPVKCSVHKIKRAKNLYELRVYGEKAIQFGKWIWENKLLPHYYKEKKFNEFLFNHNPRYVKYGKLINQALHFNKKGLDPTIIAKKLHLPYQTIYRWFKKLNCELPRRTKNAKIREKALAMYSNGITAAKITKKLHLHTGTFYTWLKKSSRDKHLLHSCSR